MVKKKILVIAPYSAHTKKFIEMIQDEYSLFLFTNKNMELDIPIYIANANKFKRIFDLLSLIKQIKPDYIHFHNLSIDNMFYSIFTKKYNTIITTWGSDVLIFPRKSLFHFLLIKTSLKFFNIISTNEAIEMQSSLKFLTNKKIHLVHFGVNRFIKFTDFNQKENIIYSPRSHKDLYNIKNIILSFAEFVKQNPQWKLILSGREDKKNTPKYKQLCEKLSIIDKIEFVGFVDDKLNSEFFKKAKIVVSIPSSDAKAVSIMEAISSNCICFLSDIPSNREFVINGLNGFLVNEKEIIDFSKYKNIDIDIMSKINKTLAYNFSYESAKSSFLQLYKN